MANIIRDLISKFSLISKILVSPRLASNGLASPKGLYGSLTLVWILSTNVLPQPNGTIGVWDDSALWVDTNVWYD